MRPNLLQVMVRKDAIDSSALFLYRKAEREHPTKPLFLSAPPAEASESVRRRPPVPPCLSPCFLRH